MTQRQLYQPIERNLAMELARVTEAAALSAARYMGFGNKELVDQSAVDAMRHTLDGISMDGVVVIGEGEKDEAPMLYVGERIGDGSDPRVDIAVDPIDGTTLLSKGLAGAIAVMAMSARGAMNVPGEVFYMDKIAVGPEAKDAVDIEAPVADNLRAIPPASRALGRKVEEVTVIVLDRPRHEQLIAEIRAVGARVKLITDGDVAAGIQAALPQTGVDVLMGVGGTTEGVLTAAAIRCVGGCLAMQALAPRRGGAQEGGRRRPRSGPRLQRRGTRWRRGCFLRRNGGEHRRAPPGRALFRGRRGNADARDAVALRDDPVDQRHAQLRAAGQDPLPLTVGTPRRRRRPLGRP